MRPAAQEAFTGYTSHDPEYRRIKLALFVAGFGWTALGWLGVVAISGSLAVVVIILALILRHIKPLSTSGY